MINKPAKYGKTIFVSNHAASFMDPLVIAAFNKAVVYFMTRSDVFNSFTKPIFWAAHMLPIYRQRDGVNTKEKNLEVFKKCSETLLRNRNLLIFGEGVTDDVFVRRLKPIKKGALRIGFTALEASNWTEDIYIAAVGCNYSQPSVYSSDLLLNNSKPIHLNLYRKQYQENPSKTINELTLKLQDLLKSTITHVEDSEDTTFHENIMTIQRKGMVHLNEGDPDLEERFNHSLKLATFINSKIKNEQGLKHELNSYFEKLNHLGIDDDLLFEARTNSISRLRILRHLILFPFVLLGLIHCGMFFWAIKKFVERKFRRPVFWGSTKLIMMIFIAGTLNLLVFVVLPKHIGWPLSILYFCLIPLFGHLFHRSITFWRRLYKLSLISKQNTSIVWKERIELNQKIVTFVE